MGSIICKSSLIGGNIPARASIVSATASGSTIRILYNRSVVVNGNGGIPEANTVVSGHAMVQIIQDGTNQVRIDCGTPVAGDGSVTVSYTNQPNWSDTSLQVPASIVVH